MKPWQPAFICSRPLEPEKARPSRQSSPFMKSQRELSEIQSVVNGCRSAVGRSCAHDLRHSSCCRSPLFDATRSYAAGACGFERIHDGVFIQAKVNSKRLWFIFDSGASRTVLDESAARRVGLRATESSALGGGGVGSVPVRIAKRGTLRIGGLTLRDVDFRLLDLRAIESAWGRRFDGIVGFDVLCHTTVEIDYAKKTLTIGGKPSGEALPLMFKHGWSFVKGTIKVPGNEPVTDWFLIDTGSQDSVDHPVIQKSSGPLRQIQSGEGSIGASSSAVVGDTEWFRIGSWEIGSTSSSCCGNPETARLIGGTVLSRFRITFDYRHARLYLAK